MEAMNLPSSVPGFAAELPDEEIVRRVISGERELFELLMRRYNQRVYRVVRAVLRRADDAEDVMQQAYLSAFRHLDQFEGRAAFSTWLTRIALREAGARNRRSAGEPLQALTGIDGEDEMSHFREPGPDPEMRAVTSDLLHHVEEELSRLPEAYRSVLVLREVEGLSTDETASCLDVNPDVVKTRLHRARAMLRDALYRRAGAGLRDAFGFGAQRCDRVVAAVMASIAAG
jgi:RNA polymerase sigma-70 factor (ECF subfamily)